MERSGIVKQDKATFAIDEDGDSAGSESTNELEETQHSTASPSFSVSSHSNACSTAQHETKDEVVVADFGANAPQTGAGVPAITLPELEDIHVDLDELEEVDLCEDGSVAKKKKQELERSRKRAVWVSVCSVLLNVAQGSLAVMFGSSDKSVALLFFGVSSLVQVLSSLLVVYRFAKEASFEPNLRPAELRKERLATMSIGALLGLLAVSTAATSIANLLAENRPESVLPGLIISGTSLVLTLALFLSKRSATNVLNSAALASDTNCSVSCMLASLVLFAGSLVYLIEPAAWWLDAAVAGLIALQIGWQGARTFLLARADSFKGFYATIPGAAVPSGHAKPPSSYQVIPQFTVHLQVFRALRPNAPA